MNRLPLVFFIAITSVLFSCRASKEVVREKPKKMDPDELYLRVMESNSRQFEWLSVRAKVSYETEKKSQSFTANIRMRRDSIVWASITSLMGIEVARIKVTRDTAYVLDKINKIYYRKPTNFIEDFLPFPFDIELLQDIIIGNVPLELNKRVKSRADEQHHILILAERPIASFLRVNPDDFTLAEASMEDKQTRRELTIKFDDYDESELGPFSYERKIIFTGEGEISADVRFSKLKWNEEQSLSFIVPEKYEERY